MKVIIVGGGQVGIYIANLLIKNNHNVTVLENRKNVYDKLKAKSELPHDVIIFGSGSDPAQLKAAGIETADVLAAVSNDDEINLVASTLAKMEFSVPRVVSRVINPKNAWLYNAGMGVDICVNQAELIAHLIVEEMDLKDMFTLLKIGKGNYSIVQMKVGSNSKAANKCVKDLFLPQNAVLIAITRNESVIIPKGDTQIFVDDDVIALAADSSRKELNGIFG